jgi:hypothetical protein
MLRFFIDEPKEAVAEYLAANLQKIRKKLKVSNTFVMTPKCTDFGEFNIRLRRGYIITFCNI